MDPVDMDPVDVAAGLADMAGAAGMTAPAAVLVATFRVLYFSRLFKKPLRQLPCQA
jgi:hypothetical protein